VPVDRTVLAVTPAPPVVVLRALGLGDALTAVPALRGLRRRYGDRPLVLAGPTPVSDWLSGLGLVDDVLPVKGLTDQPPGLLLGPHTAVNLHGRGPESHRLLLAGAPDRLIAFDCPAVGHYSESAWRSDEHEVDRWCRLIADAGGPCDRRDLRLKVPPLDGARGWVLVHPGAASRARRWPPERWAAVVSKIVAAGNQVMVTGGRAERELCARIAELAPGCRDSSGSFDVGELAGAVAAAALLISGDTGIAHLATATGTRSVTLFGPTPPAWWGPAIDPDLHTVLYHGNAAGDPHADRPDPALLSIGTGEVLDAVRDQFGRAARTRQAFTARL
jgi:ADP-heptose:LPS heptosyltransferase